MQNKLFIKILFLVSWILIIFSFSMQKDVETTKTSFGFTKSIVTFVLKITYNYNSDYQVDIIVNIIHPWMRKAAHFSEFVILSIFTLLLFNDLKIKHVYLCSIMFCFAVAMIDEGIQLFVSGRAGQLIDVLIDSFGSITYILLYKFIKKIY